MIAPYDVASMSMDDGGAVCERENENELSFGEKLFNRKGNN
jgi:hypothetical protein